MKGENQIILSEESMIEILQEWVDKRFQAADDVKVVGFSTTTAYSTVYKVSLSEKREGPASE
jgi:hypothetical protein